jgi:glycosyltransferase involved in cell wall biosynthesis
MISCIIPAYNEEKRIATVLNSVVKHPKIGEIILVDDGSIDETLVVARSFPEIKIIEQKVNAGKSKAFHKGFLESKGDIIFMLDADLLGITQKDIDDLLDPVLSGRVPFSMSMRKNSPLIDRIIGLDFFSGERVFHRKLIEDEIEKIPNLPRFGLETFINEILIKGKHPIEIVFWKNVESPYKISKKGLIKGVRGEMGMWRDIAKTIPLSKLLRQFVALRLLMRKN